MHSLGRFPKAGSWVAGLQCWFASRASVCGLNVAGLVSLDLRLTDDILVSKH